MIWLLKIELLSGAYAEDDWECEVEIESTATLEDLHFAIIEAVNFDNDHLYEFYISRTERSQDRQRFDEENGEIYNRTLESLYPLENGKKLFYMFDYGDSWLFKITKSRKKPYDADPNIEYPKILKTAGKPPEQYPIWEE
jgi:hypothetical protein